jgi:beta-xylosidase
LKERTASVRSFCHLLTEDATMEIQNPNVREEPGNLRDPAILDYGGRYYLVASSPAFWEGYTPGVKLWSSDDLVNWTFERVIISADAIPEGCHCRERFWAPELFVHGGKFYCTVNGRDTAAEEDLHSYLAVADDILGPYRLFPHPICDRNTNDVSLFADDDGRVYATASWGPIYLMEVDLSTGRAVTEPRPIAWPGKEGEWDHGPFIEGSYMVKRNGTYYLWYSGIARGYEMGWFTAESLDGPFVRYGDEPILTGLGTDLPIAGHNACFRLKDGRDAISFHAHAPGQPERLCIDVVEYPMRPRKISTAVVLAETEL